MYSHFMKSLAHFRWSNKKWLINNSEITEYVYTLYVTYLYVILYMFILSLKESINRKIVLKKRKYGNKYKHIRTEITGAR